MYCAAVFRPEPALTVVRSVPFVMPKMVVAVQANYARLGVWALLQGPVSGIPYKHYAVAAPAQISYAPFLLVSVPARLGRFVLAAVTWFLAGALARRLKWENPTYFVVAHIAIWCVLYAFYWTDAMRP